MIAYAWFMFALGCGSIALAINKEGEEKKITVHSFWNTFLNMCMWLPILGRVIGIW